MESGFSFLKSRLARRFCLLFILCAFTPTIALIILSYGQVINQLEEQSYQRLKREVKSYSLSLYDRMKKIDNDLLSIGRTISADQVDFSSLHEQYNDTFEDIFIGVGLYTFRNPVLPIHGSLNNDLLNSLLTVDNIDSQKPFVLTSPQVDKTAIFIFGANVRRPGTAPFTVIAEVKPEYLWGIGSVPMLPPLTELSVYDESGRIIVTSKDAPSGTYRSLKKEQGLNKLHILEFVHNEQVYHAVVSNLFVQSGFQKVGWTIMLSRTKREIMSAMNNFKRTFPFFILFFLLVTTYLSLLFIRKGLEPLERLKEGTKRIAQKDFSTKVNIQSNDEFEELGKSFNSMAVKLDNQFNTLTVLREIDRAILSSLDKEKIVATTLQKLKGFFGCEIALFVKVSDYSTDYIEVHSIDDRNNNEPVLSNHPISQEESVKIFTDINHHSFNPTEDSSPAFLKEIVGNRRLALLCLPLSVEKEINRALLLGRSDRDINTEDELSQARQIANQLSIALAKSFLVDNLEKMAKGTIEALARAVDAKSEWTSGHSERVSILSGKIGEIMGLSESEIATLIRGGLLHDIGKIGVPMSILDKLGTLTDDEYSQVKSHPAIGAKILEPIEAYQDILPIVAQHHERYNGTGYPAGLKGEDIDIRARILAVADVWDALVSDRPYRLGWSKEKARIAILEGRGEHFDPNVINAFLTATISQETYDPNTLWGDLHSVN